METKELRKSQLPKSLWAATAIPAAPEIQPLATDIRTEIAVIGSGFVGLNAALRLLERGHQVVVLDAAQPGWGASGRNGGQIIAGLKHDPDKLESLFGPDLGGRMIAAFGAAADQVFERVETYGIDCHAERSGWIYAAHGTKPLHNLVEPRHRQWQAHGAGGTLLTAAQISELVGCAPDTYAGGWLDRRGGVLQPLSYCRGLAQAVLAKGGAIYCQTSATRLVETTDGWTVSAGRFQIRADKVVLATNAHTDQLWPGLSRTIVPVTSFQIATKPLKANLSKTILPGNQGVTDTRRLLVYYRRDHTGRFVIGGRSPVDDDPQFSDAGSIQRLANRLFPQLDMSELNFVWSGRVAITKDRFPHLHILAPKLYTAIGCNGRGVAVGTVMGQVLGDLAAGAEPASVPFPVTAPAPFHLHGLRQAGIFALSRFYLLLDRLDAA
ncbi:NAD(P)/FAD-dependent oxidoreductase [Dongia soli]|uniref:FAD-binding oxidoreductase n=1 Tax=Dongia soli TaxID=600628 RepID=A0ABU5EAS3_9PROT|nr:FAD-binding oxidoreductase [Dongia soli]MDY0882680.1 FAD-binding oxidoreductase [Dongia soli]